MGKRLIPLFVIFNVSGFIYICLEMAWRGRSHWTMYVCAGICGLLMAELNDNLFAFETDYRIQVLVATLMCTYCEFIFGLAFNMDYSIWDYRGMWGTLHWTHDQVNLIFVGVWLVIVAVMLPVLDWMEWKLGIEDRPYYRIGNKWFYPWEEKE